MMSGGNGNGGWRDANGSFHEQPAQDSRLSDPGFAEYYRNATDFGGHNGRPLSTDEYYEMYQNQQRQLQQPQQEFDWSTFRQGPRQFNPYLGF